MKALQKAAQDRGNTTGDKTEPALPPSRSGLALEPMAPSRSTSANSTETAGVNASITTNEPQATVARPADTLRASAAIYAQHTRSGNAATWMRDHPLPVFGVLAGLFMLGYGFYIYLQAAHPGLFIRQAPAPKPNPVAAVTPPPAKQPLPAPIEASAPLANPADNSMSLPPASAVLGADTSTTRTPPARDMASAGTISPSPGQRPAQPAPPVASTAATPAPASPSQRIVVSRGDSNAPRINPTVAEAYSALQAGRLDNARQLYSQVLRTEPNNIDALLGLAAAAQQEGRTDDAIKYYLRILEIDPRHALAQSAMIAMLGRSDPLAAETRLKQLLSREPTPYLYFTLGNLYADQSQWSQAQQAYFQAHHMDPGNPDYAYNLAIGLEHLGQHKLSLGFYRRAVQLATAAGRANFNLAQAQERINQLASRAE